MIRPACIGYHISSSSGGGLHDPNGTSLGVSTETRFVRNFSRIFEYAQEYGGVDVPKVMRIWEHALDAQAAWEGKQRIVVGVKNPNLKTG
jgi:hypothetical protein